MPLMSEVTHRKHKVGQEPVTIKTKTYNRPLDEMSKDLVRELARDARMPNYSTFSRQQMIDFLQQQDELPIRNIQLKVFRGV